MRVECQRATTGPSYHRVADQAPDDALAYCGPFLGSSPGVFRAPVPERRRILPGAPDRALAPAVSNARARASLASSHPAHHC